MIALGARFPDPPPSQLVVAELLSRGEVRQPPPPPRGDRSPAQDVARRRRRSRREAPDGVAAGERVRQAQDQVAELPPPATPAPLTAPIAEIRGDSHERLLGAVVSLAREIGYRVTIGDGARAEGTCNRQTRQITIAERLAPNGRLAAGIHELAHALVGEDAAAPRLTYAQEELVVESIAWSCCQTVGLDTTANSIPYLTSWAQSASLEILEQTAALTGRLSDRIEAALSERPTDTVLEPATAATAA